MPRILHCSDTHLGHQQYGRTNGSGLNQREADIYDAFNAIVEAALRDPPDAVIHAGDLFDGVRPSNRALHVALDGFRRLGSAGIPVVIIAGNHEHPRLRETGSAFRLFDHLENVYPVYRGQRETVEVGDLAIHAVPQCANNESLAAQVAAIERTPDVANVLVVHGAVHALAAFRHAEFNELTLQPSWFDDRFDYVALGHFHGVQEVTPSAWYCGAPERVSMAEARQQKGYLDVVLQRGQSPAVTHRVVAGRPYADAPPIDATGLDGDGVRDAILAAVGRAPPGAVARVRVEDLAPDLRGLLDVRAIQQAGRDGQLLHLDLRLDWQQHQHRVQGGVALAGLAEEFAAFAAKRPVEDVDRDRLLALAQELLAEAGA